MSRGTPGDLAGTDRPFGRYGGVLVAGLGFAITRFFVAEAVTISAGTLPVVATIGSLVVGLGLTVAGVRSRSARSTRRTSPTSVVAVWSGRAR